MASAVRRQIIGGGGAPINKTQPVLYLATASSWVDDAENRTCATTAAKKSKCAAITWTPPRSRRSSEVQRSELRRAELCTPIGTEADG